VLVAVAAEVAIATKVGPAEAMAEGSRRHGRLCFARDSWCTGRYRNQIHIERRWRRRWR
jgi:hypothetical protein